VVSEYWTIVAALTHLRSNQVAVFNSLPGQVTGMVLMFVSMVIFFLSFPLSRYILIGRLTTVLMVSRQVRSGYTGLAYQTALIKLVKVLVLLALFTAYVGHASPL
jgi:hypothetical protein